MKLNAFSLITLIAFSSPVLAYTSEKGRIILEEKDWNPDDNTALLQGFLDSPDCKEIIVPAAPKNATWKVGPLFLKKGDLTFRLEKGAVLEAKPGAFSLPAGTQSVLTAHNLNNLQFIGAEGAEIRMQKEEYAKMPVAEWRHALDVSGCKDVLIEGILFSNTGGDGIYIGAGAAGHCANVTIKNIVTDGAGRNGLSIISVDGMLVEDSVFKNTKGDGNVAPKGPWAGIDVEPNKPGEMIKNLVVRNCKFLGNDRYGFLQATTFMRGNTSRMDMLIEGCEFSRNAQHGIMIAEVPGTLSKETVTAFKNCKIVNHPKAAIGILGKAQSAGVITFDDCILLNNRTAGPGALIEMGKFGEGKKDEPMGGVIFNNLTVQ